MVLLPPTTCMRRATAVSGQAVGGPPGGGAAHNLLFVAGERGVGGFAPRCPALDAHSGGVAEAGGVAADHHADQALFHIDC